MSKQIQKYIANQLSIEEKINLETRIKEDVDVRKAYQEHLDIHNSIVLQEKNSLKSRLGDLHQKQKTKQRMKVVGVILFLLFVSSIAFYWWNNRKKDPLPMREIATIYPNVIHPVTRSNPSDIYNQAFWYYEAEQYEDAAEQFKLLLVENREEDLRFYYAMSLFNAQQFSKAQIELEQLGSSSLKQFDSEVKWYLVLIYFANGQRQKSKTLAEQLQKTVPDFKKNEVRSLLQLLE
ncbi:MAG: hypothetical protein NXI23_11880 [Bacteroidetes bacterium]|nr:hypothetical protein [Bacteroidota bacterium]